MLNYQRRGISQSLQISKNSILQCHPSKIHLKLDPKAQGLMDWGPKKYESKATEPSMAGS